MQCLGSRFVDGRHQIMRRGLLDHVTGSGDAVQFALIDLVMKPARFLINIDQTIIFARNYGARTGESSFRSSCREAGAAIRRYASHIERT